MKIHFSPEQTGFWADLIAACRGAVMIDMLAEILQDFDLPEEHWLHEAYQMCLDTNGWQLQALQERALSWPEGEPMAVRFSGQIDVPLTADPNI